MPEIKQDLKLQSDPTTIVRPNIVGDNIPAGAITEDKLATGAVTQGKLASGAVGNAQLATQAVSADKIAPNAVTSAKIASGAVSNDKVANNAIDTNKIIDNSVIYEKVRIIDDYDFLSTILTISAFVDALQAVYDDPATICTYYDDGDHLRGEFRIISTDDQTPKAVISVNGTEITLGNDTDVNNFQLSYNGTIVLRRYAKASDL